tara:strand:- start:152 stop:631 length:480 start_codon:yes stop_codon:yes gene_type:complete
MSQKELEKRRKHSEYIEAQIQTVVDYLEDECDIAVEFGGKLNAFFYDDELITISNRQSPTSKLFTLLHEAGHYLLREQYDQFPVRPNKREPKSYRIDVLHEEFLAWDRGLELASELGLMINDEDWRKITHKHLYDYISWAKNPKDFRRKHVKEKNVNTA